MVEKTQKFCSSNFEIDFELEFNSKKIVSLFSID